MGYGRRIHLTISTTASHSLSVLFRPHVLRGPNLVPADGGYDPFPSDDPNSPYNSANGNYQNGLHSIGETLLAGSSSSAVMHRSGSYLPSTGGDEYPYGGSSSGNGPGSSMPRRPTEILAHIAQGDDEYHGEYGEEEMFWDGDEGEDDETRFINLSLLSHIAVQLRDKVPRGTHVKGSIPYPRAFTGKDIVVRVFVAFVEALINEPSSQPFNLKYNASSP